MDRDLEALRAGYDAVSRAYLDKFLHELDHKPFDREVLDGFADLVRGSGAVADVGCGPGQITRYLHDRGVDIRGIDLSPEMIERARELHPGIAFQVGDMLSLAAEDEAWAGIVAFYSIIHIPRNSVVLALRELQRTLRPGGRLLLCFHLGEGTNHLEEWWGKPVDIDFHFFTRDEMERDLTAAGFRIDRVRERDPYPGVEAETRRAYFLATKLPATESS